MRTTLRDGIATMLAGAVIAGLPGAAEAATRTVYDKKFDAPARFDITRIKYTNGVNVSANIKVRNLRNRDTEAGVIVQSSLDFIYVIASVRYAGGAKEKALLKVGPTGEITELPCAGMVARWRVGAENTVKLSVPRSCLTELPAEQANGFWTYTSRIGEESVDESRLVGVARY